jgi:serine/threonine-protein kinase
VVILDFGMAHIDSSHLTRAGQSAGTLSYMAPEQLRGGVCTPATDVFAAGVVFFELATGKHPFSSGNNDAPSMMMALLSQAPLDLRKIAPDAPSGLEFVLGQALEKDPKRRVHDGSELKKALESREALAPMLARLMGKSAPAAGISADYRMTVVRPRMVEALAPAAPAAEPVAAAGPAPVAAADPAPVVARAPKPVAARAPTPVKRITHYKQEAAFCPACTQANAKNATICVRCGTPLRDAAVTPASEKSGQPRLPLVILGVLGVLLVIAAIAAFFIGR